MVLHRFIEHLLRCEQDFTVEDGKKITMTQNASCLINWEYELPDDLTIATQSHVHISPPSIPERITFKNKGNVYLGGKILPASTKFQNKGKLTLGIPLVLDGIKFENEGDIDASYTKKLGENIIFNNNGNINLFHLTQLPASTIFRNKGSILFVDLEKFPEDYTFSHQGDVRICGPTQLPSSLGFINEGYVQLSSHKSLPEGVVFENKGDIFLQSLVNLPSTVKFKNTGFVFLQNLTNLPKEYVFENKGSVILPCFNKTIIFPVHILNNRHSLTREDFFSIANMEVRAGLLYLLGPEKAADLLGTILVDTWEVKHLNGEIEIIELLKTPFTLEETGGQPLAFCKFICPSTGLIYFIDVDPIHKDARSAAVSTSVLFDTDEYSFTKRS